MEVFPRDLDLKDLFDLFVLAEVYQTVIELFGFKSLKILYLALEGDKSE